MLIAPFVYKRIADDATARMSDVRRVIDAALAGVGGLAPAGERKPAARSARSRRAAPAPATRRKGEGTGS